MKTRVPFKRRPRRGAALVEMALVLPVFLSVTLGIIEFGRAMMVSELVTNAAREGARFGSLDGTTNSDVEQTVKDFLQSATNIDPNDVTVTITVTPAAGNPSANNQVSNALVRDLVEVQVQVPFSKVSFVTGNYLEGKQLVGNAAMRHE